MHNAQAASVDAERKSPPTPHAQSQGVAQGVQTCDASPDAEKPSADAGSDRNSDASADANSDRNSDASADAAPTQPQASRVEQAPTPSPASEDAPLVLRGTKRGLEIWIGAQDLEPQALAHSLKEQLDQSPSFFSGGDAILHFEQAPKPGVISALERCAQEFDVRVVAVNTATIEQKPQEEPAPRLSQRKAPSPSPSRPAPTSSRPAPTPGSARYPLPPTRYSSAYQDAKALAQEQAQEQAKQKAQERATPMMVPGPIRSGSCFEAPGHLVVVGDVNPGAEIRAEGNIVVLGSLRGIAHAGTHGEPAFILALKLQPQQLRIGSLIARAGDADNPASGAEVAYAADNMIVVDEYQGRLPSNIANSI